MKNKLWIFSLLTSFMLSSCSLYYPMMTDIPLISKKRDTRVDMGFALIPSVNATVSYGLTDKIAIQGFGSLGLSQRYYVQSAIGMYKNKGNNKILELYGGFGYGHGKAYIDANPGTLFGNYQLYFGQANYGTVSNSSSIFETGY